MAEEYPQVSKWATFFLYPFSFPAQQKDTFCAALQKAADRWQPFEFLPQDYKEHFDELAYFFPSTRKFLTEQIAHFESRLQDALLELYTSNDEAPKPTYNDIAPKLVQVRLHLFPLGIGILSLRIEGTTPLPFGRLLDFNADFRYLTKAYKIQTLPQIALATKLEHVPKDSPSQSGLLLILDDFLREIGGVPPLQLLDNRLIVYSYAALKRDSPLQGYDLDALFFKFLFVDKTSEPLPDADFRCELLARHEYRRWSKYTADSSPQSVRFGFSRYSGVVMGQEGWFFDELVFQHFRTMYYDMALILLFHRTALLKLSYDLSRVDIESQDSLERRARVRQLRAQVLEFTNRYWFGEITNQDQGIEMFDCWKNALRTEDLFDEVQAELQEYDNQLRNLNAEWLNLIVTGIAVLTLFALPLSLAASFLAIPDSTRGFFERYVLYFYALIFSLAVLWIFGRSVLKLGKTLWASFRTSLPPQLR